VENILTNSLPSSTSNRKATGTEIVTKNPFGVLHASCVENVKFKLTVSFTGSLNLSSFHRETGKQVIEYVSKDRKALPTDENSFAH
jgi:hypothetical protein